MARFSWIPLYEELATALLTWPNRQTELVAFLDGLRKSGCKIVPLEDRNAGGERFLLKEIDPFTFFGSFNRGITPEKRLGSCARQDSDVGSSRQAREVPYWRWSSESFRGQILSENRFRHRDGLAA